MTHEHYETGPHSILAGSRIAILMFLVLVRAKNGETGCGSA